MTGRATETRWRLAQSSEAGYWQGMNLPELLRICAEKPSFLAMVGEARLHELFDGKDVLEVGCGPCAISLVSFYHDKSAVRRLVKTEPLPRLSIGDLPAARSGADRPFWQWVEGLSEEGEYVQIPGENLGFHQEFDTVVTYNVIDHVQAPLQLLRNAHAALRPGGAILVGVDCMSALGKLKFEGYVRRALPDAIVVQAHPHTFLVRDVERLIRRAGFVGVECIGRPAPWRALAGSHSRPAFIGIRPS